MGQLLLRYVYYIDLFKQNSDCPLLDILTENMSGAKAAGQFFLGFYSFG
jgi:hypothetical protein